MSAAPRPLVVTRLVLATGFVALLALGACGGDSMYMPGRLALLINRLMPDPSPSCEAIDRRTFALPRNRTRRCAFQADPRFTLWQPPRSMGQPRLMFEAPQLPDTMAALGLRDSLLAQIGDGVSQPRPCRAVPPREAVIAIWAADFTGTELAFVALRSGDGRVQLRMAAAPVGTSLPERRGC